MKDAKSSKTKRNQISDSELKSFLYEIFSDLEKEKTSDFAKLLYQENLISMYIAYTLKLAENYINSHTAILKPTKKGERKLEFNHVVEINFPPYEELLSNNTLGKLKNLLSMLLCKNNLALENLKNFITVRNKITHRIFSNKSNYRKLSEVQKDAKKATEIGHKVIKELSELVDKLDNTNSYGNIY